MQCIVYFHLCDNVWVTNCDFWPFRGKSFCSLVWVLLRESKEKFLYALPAPSTIQAWPKVNLFVFSDLSIMDLFPYTENAPFSTFPHFTTMFWFPNFENAKCNIFHFSIKAAMFPLCVSSSKAQWIPSLPSGFMAITAKDPSKCKYKFIFHFFSFL